MKVRILPIDADKRIKELEQELERYKERSCIKILCPDRQKRLKEFEEAKE